MMQARPPWRYRPFPPRTPARTMPADFGQRVRLEEVVPHAHRTGVTSSRKRALERQGDPRLTERTVTRRPDATPNAQERSSVWSPVPLPPASHPSVPCDGAGTGAGLHRVCARCLRDSRRRLPMPPSIAEVHAALTAPGQMFEMEEVVIRGSRLARGSSPPSLLAVLGRRATATRASATRTTLTFRHHFAAAATLAHRLIDDFGVRRVTVAIAMRNSPVVDRVLGRRGRGR